MMDIIWRLNSKRDCDERERDTMDRSRGVMRRDMALMEPVMMMMMSGVGTSTQTLLYCVFHQKKAVMRSVLSVFSSFVFVPGASPFLLSPSRIGFS